MIVSVPGAHAPLESGLPGHDRLPRPSGIPQRSLRWARSTN